MKIYSIQISVCPIPFYHTVKICTIFPCIKALYVWEAYFHWNCLYKQFLWKLPIHSGVANVTEAAYMWYLESTDFAFIVLRSFCGNCPTRMDLLVPQILLIKLLLPDRIFFQCYQNYKQILCKLLLHPGRAVSTETGYKLDFIIKVLFQISQILKLRDYDR